MRKWYKALMLGAVVLVFAGSGVYIWLNWYPEYKRDREGRAEYEKLLRNQTEYEEQVFKAFAEDTYGGKTPQETLRLFVEALKKGDVELASKYFILNTEAEAFGTSEFLSREKWREALAQAQKEGRLGEMADKVSRAVPDLENRSGDEDFKLTVHNKAGDLEAYINMQLNPVSNVWKIESL